MTTKTLARTADEIAAATDGITRIATGRITSTLLELALDMDLFAKLADRAVALKDLGGVWGMPNSSARLIAQSLTNIGLLRFQGGEISLEPETREFLVDDAAVIENTRKNFRFNFTAEQLRHVLLNPPPHIWYQLRDHGKVVSQQMLGQTADNYLRRWQGGLHEERIVWGRELAGQYDFSRHEVLLEVGGASGGWSIGIRKVFPHLRCKVFDIADAAKVAAEKIAEAEEGDSIEAVGGSVFTDELPAGADVVLMSYFLDVWSADDTRYILKKVYAALAPGGAVLVKEPFLEDDWRGAINPLLIAFVLFGAEGKGGQQASYAEMEQFLSEAGFVRTRRKTNLVIGDKP